MTVRLNGAGLAGAKLAATDLAWVSMVGTQLQGAMLRLSNLSAADLSRADLSGAVLEMAMLLETNFSGAELSGACLKNADATRAVFRRANCTGVCFQGCNLTGADFSGATLRGVNFHDACISAANLTDAKLPEGIPIVKDIHRALWRVVEAYGLSTTRHHEDECFHSRAGWVVTLAGDEGRWLEKRLGTVPAAALIYAVSGLGTVPDLIGATKDTMISDISRCAEEVPV